MGKKKIPFPLFPFSPFPLLRRPQKKFEDGKKIGKKKKNMIDGYVYILMALPIKKKANKGFKKRPVPTKKGHVCHLAAISCLTLVHRYKEYGYTKRTIRYILSDISPST